MLIKYLNNGRQIHGDRLFLVMITNRTRANGNKLECGKLHMIMRIKFITLRMTQHWNKLPREVVDIKNEHG